MRSTKTALMAIAAATLIGLLPGCGSNRETGGSTTTDNATPLGVDAENRAYVGADKCITCHTGFSWSVDVVADYLVGKHVVHNTSVDASMAAEGCLACHDPIGDGRRLEGLIAVADVPAAGLAAVTCEACHGAGGDHYGVGPIPTATPDYTVCGNCHNAAFANSTAGHTDFTEALNILADYTASPHNTGSLRNSAICVKCHTDEGGRQYKNVSTWDGLSATLPIDAGASKIQCRTCHNAHNPGELLKPAITSRSGAVTASSEYATCTNCHQPANAQVTVDPSSGTTDGASGDLIYHSKRWDRVISSTHYDNPATTNIIEGYVVKATDDRSCRDCHNVHSADITINQQWAKSGHGGNILDAKETAAATQTNDTFAQVTAVRAAGTTADPFVHYDWDATYKAGNALDRADCQRCHTATGAKNYLTSPTTYDPTTNDFSHLSGWKLHNTTDGATVSSGQNELLYCWGCHTNNNGGLRAPGPITATYKFHGAAAAFPDVSDSNICVSCHAARESGESVQALTAAANPFTNVSFVNSHYMGAAGLMFVKLGYTNFVPANTAIGTSTTSYGQSLTSDADQTVDISNVATAGKVTSTHRKFGTTAINGYSGNPDFFVPGNLDSGGPCVTCHMADRADNNDKRSHTLEIDGNAFTAVCSNCHTSEGATVLTADNFIDEFVDAQAVPFENALDLALATLQANYHITYDPLIYPYFYDQDAAGAAVKDWTRPSAPSGLLDAAQAEKLMGACFNINVLSREPAAYAHARTYTRRLLYDSIDWLDDQTINLSTGATAIAWDGVIYAKGVDANTAPTTESMKYLNAYSRSTGAWSTPERP